MSPERIQGSNSHIDSKSQSAESPIVEQHRILTEIVDKLTDPKLMDLVRKDRLTFGLIRPQLNDPRQWNRSQPELVDELVASIRAPLRVEARLPLSLDKQAIEGLWDGYSRTSMQSKLPLDPKRLGTRWDEFMEFMLSGESTGLLLSTSHSGASEEWREQIGRTWEVAKLRRKVQDDLVAMPRFVPLRARFAPENPDQAILNNALHGSRDIAEVEKDLSVLRLWAARQLQKLESATS
jgi:hypothetical protein